MAGRLMAGLTLAEVVGLVDLMESNGVAPEDLRGALGTETWRGGALKRALSASHEDLYGKPAPANGAAAAPVVSGIMNPYRPSTRVRIPRL